MTMRSIKQELDEAAAIIRMQVARIAELEGEVVRLKAGLDAHAVLREIYSNPASPEGNRIRAAQAALNIEKPRLAPVPPPLELVAEPVEPLAQLVERRRARQNALCPQSVGKPSDSRSSPILLSGGPVLGNGNGDGGEDASSD